MNEHEKVVLSDQPLWSIVNGHRRPTKDRADDLFTAVKHGTEGFESANQLELVIRARPPATASPVGTFDVKSCARCGEDHEGVEFRKFTRPLQIPTMDPWVSRWALCPTSGEPILMAIVKNKEGGR